MLEILEKSKGEFLSGNELAGRLDVSRNAVWKAVKALQEDGYRIQAVTNRGYCLTADNDVLSEPGILGYLREYGAIAPFAVEVFKSLTSTNTVLRERAAGGAAEGLVIAANTQTAGRGRQGRSFFSPADHGAYFSMLLRPQLPVDVAAHITAAASVAVARAVEDVAGVPAGIKWVNDVFAGGRKICGILTEASLGMESGLVESAVLGIGINVSRPADGLPEELADIATTLADQRPLSGDTRCRLIARTLTYFWEYYENLAAKTFLAEYRARSIILGHNITVLGPGEPIAAHALEIDDDCRLVVRYDSGETAALASGEVSIRRID